jgi:signal transduction histidine kinase
VLEMPVDTAKVRAMSSLPSASPKPLDPRVTLASIFGFWVFYIGIVSLRAAVLEFPVQEILFFRRLIVSGIGILITILFWQFIRLFDAKPLGARIGITALAAIPCALAIAATNYYFFNVYDPISLLDDAMPRQPVKHEFLKEVVELSTSRYFFLVAWAALYVALTFANHVRESERRAAAFAQAAQQAELRALRYQVNPHFLFNTLNSLSSLVITGRNREAEEMIMNLATFFRSSLSGDPTMDVPLEDEIALQQLYLAIEAVRFPNRLRVEIDLPQALAGARVPGLILQPLVENAIKHGVAQTKGEVKITIRARREADRLHILVENAGKAALRPSSDGEGIGLANVANRLNARFQGQAVMRTERPATGVFRVLLILPAESH